MKDLFNKLKGDVNWTVIEGLPFDSSLIKILNLAGTKKSESYIIQKRAGGKLDVAFKNLHIEDGTYNGE